MLGSRECRPGYAGSRAVGAIAIAVAGIAIAGTALAGSASGQVQPIPSASSAPAALSALDCRTLTDCVAVGTTSPQMATGVVAETWNGSRWSRSALPKPAGATEVTLNDVACPAARECVAVGAYGTSKGLYPDAEYWNGSRWSVGGAATVGALSSLSAISCPAPASCYAVGYYMPAGSTAQYPLVEHWNGSGWHQVPVPVPSGGDHFYDLSGISCQTAALCVAVGLTGTGALVERWNGHTWTDTAPPSAAGALLTGVSCPAVTRCFAVGVGPARTHSLVDQWNGTKWSSSYTPGPTLGEGLQSVSCVSSARCLAVGNYTGNGVYAVAWNGHGWQRVAVAATGGKLGYLEQVDCLSATSCVALGATTVTAATERFESVFWNGKTWKVVPTA